MCANMLDDPAYRKYLTPLCHANDQLAMHIGYAYMEQLRMIEYITMDKLHTEIVSILATAPDPLGVRKTTAALLERPQYVRLHVGRLKAIAPLLQKNIASGHLLTESQFGTSPKTAQLVFLLDVVNFCFWAQRGKPRWTVEYPKGIISNGWAALTACFSRALGRGVPVFDARYLATLSLRDAAALFHGTRGVLIPLLNKRCEYLRQAGRVLLAHFNGDITNLVKKATYDAPRIAQEVIRFFPSFGDTATSGGCRVFFYKRAQIFAYDLSLLPGTGIKHLSPLTVFADYKLPQLLRSLGVLSYTSALARNVDSYALIPKGSREEAEIRAATIWAGEILAKELGVVPVLVDNALWVMAREGARRVKPYHRTLTTSY